MFRDFSLLSDQISGQNKKSLNTFVSGVKDSSLCGSVWTEASDTVHLTYLPDSAADLHSSDNTKEQSVKQIWHQGGSMLLK